MWQDHYQSLLNSVKSLEHKTSVTTTLSSIENKSIEIRPLDIVNALKSVNKGKACGVDGLAAEHFIYADERIHVILSILFNCFISHRYLPSEFMKTAIVPIIKNKTGDTSDKNNYRPIALVTACSKIFELCIVSIIENYICTHDHQFGFNPIRSGLFQTVNDPGGGALKAPPPLRSQKLLCQSSPYHTCEFYQVFLA